MNRFDLIGDTSGQFVLWAAALTMVNVIGSMMHESGFGYLAHAAFKLNAAWWAGSFAMLFAWFNPWVRDTTESGSFATMVTVPLAVGLFAINYTLAELTVRLFAKTGWHRPTRSLLGDPSVAIPDGYGGETVGRFTTAGYARFGVLVFVAWLVALTTGLFTESALVGGLAGVGLIEVGLIGNGIYEAASTRPLVVGRPDRVVVPAPDDPEDVAWHAKYGAVIVDGVEGVDWVWQSPTNDEQS